MEAPDVERGFSFSLPDLKQVMVKAGGENFPVASRLLPKRFRRYLRAIYGFARLVDDIGDEMKGDRRAALAWLDAELERAFLGSATHPVMRRLSLTVAECGLDPQPFRDLIEANRMDQEVARYETWEQLKDYCRLSAEPVGRLVLAVTGLLTAERQSWSDSVCTGLQLAEHWQDVREDYERGRIYLPSEDMERFGVIEADLAAPRATPQLVDLMRFEVDRARTLLTAAGPLVFDLRGVAPIRIRWAIAAYAGGGTAALDAIARGRFDVLVRVWRPAKAATLRNTIRLVRASTPERSAHAAG
jgi:squalene synthase HpnC